MNFIVKILNSTIEENYDFSILKLQKLPSIK